MKKLLTSILAIGFAMPAMAENITNASSCNTGVLGQSDNNSTANVEATWTANTYSEPAGQYLLFNNGTITQHTTCPAGSFCVGFTNQTFADSSMGLQSCPSGYTQSAAGTTTQDDCYNASTIACATANAYTGGHGTAVYGNATNASAESCKYYYGNQNTCALDTANACDITALNCDTGYHQTGGTSPLASVDTSIDGDDNGNGIVVDANEMTWETIFDYGTWQGQALCSTTNGTYAQTGTPNETGGGQYCWCKTTGYIPDGGSLSSAVSSWVFSDDYGDSDFCAGACVDGCASLVRDISGFRGALVAAQQSSGALQCTANTINIDWDPQNGEAHTTNQCTYDGAITLPAEPSKTGYTFGGWRLKTN